MTTSSSNNDDKTVLATASIRIGSILKNRFVIKEVLGSGGMGTVFRATDMRKQETQDRQPDVAIKVLNDVKDDPELLIALQRASKKTQLLAHPNIITVYDFDKDGKHVFMVMELLQGKPLSRFIREEVPGGMKFKDAWPIIKSLMLAVSYAHSKHIIHSDLESRNVFITDEGDIKVLNFGITRAALMLNVQRDRMRMTFNARDLSALIPVNASLELLLGKDLVPADDVYALACVCYELLSGKHPYRRLSAYTALHLNLQAPAIKGINRRVRSAFLRALALERKQRTATVSEFLEAIKPVPIRPRVYRGLDISIFMLVAVAAGYYASKIEQPVTATQLTINPPIAQQEFKQNTKKKLTVNTNPAR